MKTVGIVLAGGTGRRMGAETAKQYLMLGEYPVLYYSLKAMEKSFLDEIILVTGPGQEQYCRTEIIEKYGLQKISAVVAGGKERYHSVAKGLEAVEEADYAFIHDGARPFLTSEILRRGMETVQRHDACAAGMPVKDTIKLADEKNRVAMTPPRDRVWQIQTPQVFSFPLIRDAYRAFLEKEQPGITDDAMVVETMTGKDVYLFEGSYGNIKITTPEDMEIGLSLLEKYREFFC